MGKIAGILFALILLAAAPGRTAPMRVVYSSTKATHFSWKWPYHPVETYTAVQTKPYLYIGRILNLTHQDLSKYRFHYPNRTCCNDWGYFFPAGTKLCSKRPLVIFKAPNSYYEVISQK
jgi:hypothetical protein